MRVAVIGAGTMGSGIAQLTAMAGHETALVDLDERQLERALSGIAQSLERFVRKEKIDADESAAVRARLRTTTQLAEGVAGADVVIESVIEVLDVKQAVFRQVVEHAWSTRCSGPTRASCRSRASVRPSRRMPTGSSACTSSTHPS